jgi:hypothetical protein
MIRKLLAVAVAAVAFASVQGVASADPAPQEERCKSGEFAKYVDPTTDLPFKNQGQCVAFVGQGGQLGLDVTVLHYPDWDANGGLYGPEWNSGGLYGFEYYFDVPDETATYTMVWTYADGHTEEQIEGGGNWFEYTGGWCRPESLITNLTVVYKGTKTTIDFPPPVACANGAPAPEDVEATARVWQYPGQVGPGQVGYYLRVEGLQSWEKDVKVTIGRAGAPYQVITGAADRMGWMTFGGGTSFYYTEEDFRAGCLRTYPITVTVERTDGRITTSDPWTGPECQQYFPAG